jgi:N-acetylglucosamine-6-sulfatase
MVRIFLLLWATTIATGVAERSQKNIIMFMTDDQDVTANSIDPTIMPKLNRLFREEGMEFTNYYVPTGLCCPSRATILRGQYCHNTKVFDNGDFNNSTYKSGGWAKFVDTGLEEETFPTLLQSAGYETAMIGKYMNGYNLYDDDAPLHKPPGFDHWMGLLKCFNFYGPIFSDGKRILKTNSTVYQTDFIRDWAVDFLRNKRDTSKVCVCVCVCVCVF